MNQEPRQPAPRPTWDDGLPELAAFGVYSDIGRNMRALTKLTSDEAEADRYCNRQDMARIAATGAK